jgi:hypothetical protein
MRRSSFNFALDFVTLLLMLVMISTGLIIRFVLPPGTGGREGGGQRLWAWGRHDWGDLHFWLAVSLGALLVVHVAMHWSWVCGLLRRRRSAPPGISRPVSHAARNVSGVSFLVLLAAGIAALVWIARNDVETLGQGGRAAQEQAAAATAIPIVGEAPDARRQATRTDTDDKFIRGSMTLAELSAATGIPHERILQELHLPLNTGPDMRLGWLRQHYGVEMSQFRAFAEARVTESTHALDPARRRGRPDTE